MEDQEAVLELFMGAWQSREGQHGTRSGQSGKRFLGVAADLAAWVGRVSLLAAVLAAPWFLGAVQAWVQVWIFGAMLVAIAGSALYLLLRSGRRDPVTVPVTIVPLLAAIGLGVFQLLPLERDTLALASPRGVSIADEFGAESDSGEGEVSAGAGATAAGGRQVGQAAGLTQGKAARRPVTVYPAATRQGLALLILATSSPASVSQVRVKAFKSATADMTFILTHETVSS